ncbi:uncharacterized protein B0J16DRAFT_274314 [Fusarium flagelliforme]|uniref:uncharacterized protein n=1 Tax=Fusarium flagelliforme TaxID=2675880 RepID=UPI001E8D137E|nr:uncharacterized protein B0J16DRAFT_274314 [Fusarium flagelliforme]KAH7174923.1 hypothetical protein B0J16DRAFT_274314 [Fusarium flagelliforme]
MDNTGADNSTQPEQTAQTSDVGLACNWCRRRQDCVYETKRARPGMKAGAIENLHKRLDALERSISKQQTTLESLRTEQTSSNQTNPRQNVTDGQSLLFSLAQEICKLGNPPPSASPGRAESTDDATNKRRRIESDSGYRGRPSYAFNRPMIPDDDSLDQVVDAYFRQIHPWIPMIHETRFRKRLRDNRDDASLILLLQSMILVAFRHVYRRDVAESIQRLIGDQDDVRDWVVAQATKRLSVENLQALIIICFHDNVRKPTGHPSLSHTSLFIFHADGQKQKKGEEYSDRFCSVTTAWNTSLTADDVNRRLPCDGITWRKEDPVSTPYFGIWDKSAGRIGNPIAFLPSHSTVAPTTVAEDGMTPSEATTSPGAAASSIDMSTVGAFAYRIEATESLSRVTSYFLQQKVNIKDHNDLSCWLTRFKELDVRLVHWKMLLPKKWKVNIAQQSSRMDPNLTLAHVTHNTSMILLHQPIAFPPLDWTFRTRLPSFCSLDTCQAAAIEIATITNHYLQIVEHTGPLSNEFAFCVYLAARVFLLYWRYCSTDALSSEFWTLIQSLETMAKRWAGPHQLGPQQNLASKYRSILIELYNRCIQDQSFSINPSAYTTEVKHSKAAVQPQSGTPRLQSQNVGHSVAPRDNLMHQSDAQFIQPNVPANALFNGATTNLATGPTEQRSGSVGSGDLSIISQMLLDAEFVDMDRVISFDDGIFGTEQEGGCF